MWGMILPPRNVLCPGGINHRTRNFEMNRLLVSVSSKGDDCPSLFFFVFFPRKYLCGHMGVRKNDPTRLYMLPCVFVLLCLFVDVSWVHSSGCVCVSQCNNMFMLYCVVLYCSGKLIYCPPRHCTPPVSIGARPNVNEQERCWMAVCYPQGYGMSLFCTLMVTFSV